MQFLYSFGYSICLVSFHAFYKRVHFRGLENIPVDKPAIIACNHPNSFLEAITVAVFYRYTIGENLHFLVRGDVFKNPLARKALNALNMLPIYREQDGDNNFDANLETFNAVTKLLENKQRIMIFAEGICIVEKRLRPIKKGAAKALFHALNTAQKPLDDLQLIPMGVNYTYPSIYRKGEFMMRVGEPIDITPFKEIAQENQAKAINEVTKCLRVEMAKHVVIIDKKEAEAVTEVFLEINRNTITDNALFPIQVNQDVQLVSEKILAEKVNAFFENEASAQEISALALDYKKRLTKNNIDDRDVAGTNKFSGAYFIPLVVLAPLFAAGFVLNCLPFLWASNFTKKNIKSNVFYASVLFGATTIGYLIYLIVVVLILAFISWKAMLASILVLPAMGFFALFYRDVWHFASNSMRWNKYRKTNPAKATELSVVRKELLKLITTA